MIRLSRSIAISTFDSEATVAVGRDRPEFLAVARLAADLGRPIDARDILRELLGNRPEVVGRKVIDRCVALRLLEREGTSGPAALSDAGRLALEHGAVLVPEEGLWRFYLVDDPLIPDILIHAERIEGDSMRDERRALAEAKKSGVRRQPAPDAPPNLLGQTVGAAPRESVARGYLFQLVDLPQGGAEGDEVQGRLELVWDQDVVLRVQAALPTSAQGAALRVDAQLSIPDVLGRLSREALWTALAAHGSGVPAAELNRWRELAKTPVLPSRFEGLPEAARRGFARDLPVPASSWKALGDFEATSLKAVKLVPATDPDAQAWFEWLQWEELTGYATPPQIEQQGRALLTKFPHHGPRPRTSAELLARARSERGDRAWNVLAPFDLGLWS
jgi:hypothetical protein